MCAAPPASFLLIFSSECLPLPPLLSFLSRVPISLWLYVTGLQVQLFQRRVLSSCTCVYHPCSPNTIPPKLLSASHPHGSSSCISYSEEHLEDKQPDTMNTILNSTSYPRGLLYLQPYTWACWSELLQLLVGSPTPDSPLWIVLHTAPRVEVQ